MTERLTEARENEIRYAISHSTQVVTWSPYSENHTPSLIQPTKWIYRSFEIEACVEYKNKIWNMNDDTRYCALAMNAVPELLREIDALRAQLLEFRKEIECG